MNLNRKILWTPEQEKLLRDLRPIFSAEEMFVIFNKFGFVRTKKSINKKIEKLKLKFLDGDLRDLLENETYKSEHKKIFQEVFSKREHKETLFPQYYNRERSKIKREQRNETADHYYEILSERESIPRIGSISKNRSKDFDKESLCIVLSDFHVGRLIYNEEGEEIFNKKIAIERMRRMLEEIEKVVKQYALNVDEVVLVLAGDLVDGEGIFPGQEMALEHNVIDQMKVVTSSLWALVKKLKYEYNFPHVRIVTCRGNHGRTNLSDEANWDNIIYSHLEIMIDMENDKDLTIKNSKNVYNTFEVKGWKGLVRHHAPVHADVPSSKSKLGGWYAQHKWDCLIYGHWHHWGVMTWNGKPIFRNGSLCGADEYAESLAVFDNATQLIFGVSGDKLPTFIYPIYFE